MVAKINNGSNLYGAIAYNYEKVKAGKGSVLATNRIIENMNPEQDLHIYLALRSFEPYLIANKRTSKPIVHISINPDVEDKLSDEEYVKLAEDYLKKMHFGDQPYIIYKHQDIDRIHLHVVTTRLDEQGKKKMSDSYENIRNKDVCRQLEIEHGLKVISNYKSTAQTNRLKKIDYQKGDVKNQIHNTVRTLLEEYKFQTFGEYNALLSCFNIHVKQVRGESLDYPYKGLIYSAMNEKGEPVGVPVKSSRMSKLVGYDALEKTMKKHIEVFKKGKVKIYTRRLIATAMKNSKSISEFKEHLRRSNLDVVFRINENGRIYGVTFIDHSNKLVYNGSRLGKEYSANVFNSLFNSVQTNSTNDLSTDINTLDFGTDVQMNSPVANADEVFGRFSLNYQGQDLELEFRKAMRKKKKKMR
ncbi:MAG: relaxase/mobilization nuclease domain-containing protein [Clostridium sp.]|nr:relaxase/mobilization nuclease domain-containing protein [Clostridium sp.]